MTRTTKHFPLTLVRCLWERKVSSKHSWLIIVQREWCLELYSEKDVLWLLRNLLMCKRPVKLVASKAKEWCLWSLKQHQSNPFRSYRLNSTAGLRWTTETGYLLSRMPWLRLSRREPSTIKRIPMSSSLKIFMSTVLCLLRKEMNQLLCS